MSRDIFIQNTSSQVNIMEYKTKVFIGSVVGGIILCWWITVVAVILSLVGALVGSVLR